MSREEIRARWDAATEGDWYDDTAVTDGRPGVWNGTVRIVIADTVEDAEAIAHAPTDVRALLDELEAQDRLIEQLGTSADWLARKAHITSPTDGQAWDRALAALSTWKDEQ